MTGALGTRILPCQPLTPPSPLARRGCGPGRTSRATPWCASPWTREGASGSSRSGRLWHWGGSRGWSGSLLGSGRHELPQRTKTGG